MSLIKEEYQKQMDTFCNENNKITAQDILNKAQNTSVKEEKVVSMPIKKSRSMVWRAAIPTVICFLLLGTTTAAATGKFSDFFRNIFRDEKTAEIVDSGFYSDVNVVKEDELFTAQIVGVSGDAQNAMVALDIYVKDPTVTEGRDKIYLEAYCMSREVYENQLAYYAPWEAYGVQDEENKNLYHVSLRTGIWLADGQESVLEIVQIRLGSQKTLWDSYDVSLKFDLQVGTDAFYPVQHIYYEDQEMKCGDITYQLIYVLSGYYHTEVIFRSADTDKFTENAIHKDTGMSLYETWIQFIDQLVLVVDGVEYKVNPEDKSFPCYESEEGGYYHMHPYFAGFEFDKATNVELRYGDVVVKVKGDERVEETVEETDVPELTGKPEATAEPVFTPEPTEMPQPTATPVATETPQPTETPTPTEAPFNVKEPLVLSGDPKEVHVLTEPEYVTTDKFILFMDAGTTLYGNTAELIETVFWLVEKETGLSIDAEAEYDYLADSGPCSVFGSLDFAGVEPGNDKYHIYVLPPEKSFPCGGYGYMILNPQDLEIAQGNGDAIVHEYTHSLHTANGPWMNRILTEGYATYITGEITRKDALLTFDFDADFNYSGYTTEITKENAEQLFLQEPEDAWDDYLYGYRFMHFLVETYGKDVFQDILSEALSIAPDSGNQISREETAFCVKENTSEKVFEKFAEWLEVNGERFE